MKIISYSDLHLEFRHGWALPAEVDTDLMILDGDVITFGDYRPLERFLEKWRKPVLYVPGNHEYYTQASMDREIQDFAKWLSENLPHIILLQNEGITVGGVHFFGGTMWMDSANENPLAMMHARMAKVDYFAGIY